MQEVGAQQPQDFPMIKRGHNKEY